MEKIVKSWNEWCLETKTTEIVRLENMDLLEYYSYGYNNFKIIFNFTYLLCIKIWGSLDLEVRSYESFNNRML